LRYEEQRKVSIQNPFTMADKSAPAIVGVTAREVESAMLARCIAVARGIGSAAQDQREANVFRLAAIVVRSQFLRETGCLMLVSEQYFAEHPTERLTPGEVIRIGWVIGLPRLRDRLIRGLLERW